MFWRNKDQIDLFVVQPTTFCNINCSYCYLPDRAVKKRLAPETFRQALWQLKKDQLIGKEFTVVWHAGEPLATGIPQFKELLEVAEEFKQTERVNVRHSIQTNGILINQEWCDIFKKYNVQIGISVDGPEFIHDTYRLTRSGKGTFNLVMKGVNFLKENAIPYHGIAVITEKSLDYPQEIFNFFLENGFYNMGLNIEEIEGQHSESSLENPELERKFQTFWQTVYNLYLDSDQKMKVREFDHVLKSIFRHPQISDIRKVEPKSHQISPFAIITMDTEGNFSTFSPELLGQNSAQFNNFIFGNVNNGSFLKAGKLETFRTVKHDIQSGVKKCRDSCEYFYLCGGGAPSNKYYENNSFDSTTTLYCKYTIKAPINVVLNSLENQMTNA